jgi:mono/diheme cytochrome c family protein
MLLLLGFATCAEQDMFVQQRASPWGRFAFLPNGMTMQHPVPGTVARHAPDTPVPAPARITAEMLAHGQEAFDVNCSPCHGRSGDGYGMIVERGFPRPPPLFSAELRKAGAQHLYDVITNGTGVMFSYADRVRPADRWAIVAYLRALQFGQHADVASLDDQDRAKLAEAGQ